MSGPGLYARMSKTWFLLPGVGYSDPIRSESGSHTSESLTTMGVVEVDVCGKMQKKKTLT